MKTVETKIRVKRENGEEVKILAFKDFTEDLKFQIAEDCITVEEYEEYKIEHNKDISLDEFMIIKFNNLISEMDDGYSISIMGDTYSYM